MLTIASLLATDSLRTNLIYLFQPGLRSNYPLYTSSPACSLPPTIPTCSDNWGASNVCCHLSCIHIYISHIISHTYIHITYMYYTHVHIYIHMYIHTYLPVGPKIKGFSMCVYNSEYTPQVSISFGHTLNHKYICSYQCCTNTHAHINAVQTHMLTSMLYK